MYKLSITLITTLLFFFIAFSQIHAQISLTLSADKSTFQLGEPLVVNVELKNAGSSPVEIE